MLIFLLNYLLMWFLVPHHRETEFFYLYVKVLSQTQASFQRDETLKKSDFFCCCHYRCLLKRISLRYRNSYSCRYSESLWWLILQREPWQWWITSTTSQQTMLGVAKPFRNLLLVAKRLYVNSQPRQDIPCPPGLCSRRVWYCRAFHHLLPMTFFPPDLFKFFVWFCLKHFNKITALIGKDFSWQLSISCINSLISLRWSGGSEEMSMHSGVRI